MVLRTKGGCCFFIMTIRSSFVGSKVLLNVQFLEKS